MLGARGVCLGCAYGGWRRWMFRKRVLARGGAPALSAGGRVLRRFSVRPCVATRRGRLSNVATVAVVTSLDIKKKNVALVDLKCRSRHVTWRNWRHDCRERAFFRASSARLQAGSLLTLIHLSFFCGMHTPSHISHCLVSCCVSSALQ